MTRLGIDIVDLNDHQLKKRDERAMKLVINSKDKTIEHPLLYWILWSAKEAIFKCYREAWNFSPTQIPVALSETDGVIFFSSKDLQGKIEISDSYILAICSDDLEMVEYEIINTDRKSNGTTIRENIISFFNAKNIDISIGSDDLNLPILLPNKDPISVSHHYHWSAFAYPKGLAN